MFCTNVKRDFAINAVIWILILFNAYTGTQSIQSNGQTFLLKTKNDQCATSSSLDKDGVVLPLECSHVEEHWADTLICCSVRIAAIHNWTNSTIDTNATLDPVQYTKTILQNVSSITKKYQQYFQPLDVFIVAQVLSEVQYVDAEILEVCLIIINDITNISYNVLRTSQEIFNATDILLEAFNNIAGSYSGDLEIHENNVRLVITLLERTDAYIKKLWNCLTCCNATNGSGYEINISSGSIKDILNRKNINYTPSVVLKVFYSSALFIETYDYDYASPIVGIHIPGYEKEFLEAMKLSLGCSDNDISNYTCSRWQIWDEADQAGGFWFRERPLTFEETPSCNFYGQHYYAVLKRKATAGNLTSRAQDDPINVTKKLKNIMSTNYTTSRRLYATQVVTTRYSDHFRANDVYLISRILAKVEKVYDSWYMVQITNIIILIEDLERDVLIESQDRFNATDWIVYHVDRIASNSDHPMRLMTKYVVIIISYNISGLTIDNEGNVELLRNDANITSILDNGTNTALIFDSPLKEAIEKTSSKVSITVYFNTVLFNQGRDNPYREVSPIVSLLVPFKMTVLNGSAHFFYNRRGGDTEEEACASWDYRVHRQGITRGYWEVDGMPQGYEQFSMCDVRDTTHFALLRSIRNVTSDLEDLLNSNASVAERLRQVDVIVSDSVEDMGPVEIHIISMILESALEDVTVCTVNVTSQIVSGLFNVPRKTLRQSQIEYLATDRILYVMEEMVKKLDEPLVDPIIHNNFTIAIYNLENTTIRGLVLENCSDARCSISLIREAVNFTELVGNQHLRTVVALSEELLDQITEGVSVPRLIVTIYFSDVLFNEVEENGGNAGMVCGVLLPGLDEVFSGKLYVAYNGTEDENSDGKCSFWHFQIEDEEAIVQGSWVHDTNPQNKEHITICEYDHVTHFALLLARDGSGILGTYTFLEAITTLNCVLSLMGLLGILLTAALFRKWRRSVGNQILVHFSVAMSIKIVMLYTSVYVFSDGTRRVFCSLTGAILHYAILSEFCWMFNIAILQYKRFVEVLGGPPQFVLLKACVCGWLFPVVPVVLVFSFDKHNYYESNAGLCYPSGLGLYLGVWLPIALIVVINSVIFIFIVHSVFHRKTESRDAHRDIIFQWRLALLLFFMLGLTWLFGFLAQIPVFGDAFLVPFCVFATLQGFVMFLFFIVFNKSTRSLYSHVVKLWFHSI